MATCWDCHYGHWSSWIDEHGRGMARCRPGRSWLGSKAACGDFKPIDNEPITKRPEHDRLF